MWQIIYSHMKFATKYTYSSGEILDKKQTFSGSN